MYQLEQFKNALDGFYNYPVYDRKLKEIPDSHKAIARNIYFITLYMVKLFPTFFLFCSFILYN